MSFLGIFGERLLPETKQALRAAERRDPHMKRVAREARRDVLGKGRRDHQSDADRRDHGFWSW